MEHIRHRFPQVFRYLVDISSDSKANSNSITLDSVENLLRLFACQLAWRALDVPVGDSNVLGA
jgi:hypothetical protein